MAINEHAECLAWWYRTGKVKLMEWQEIGIECLRVGVEG